MPDDQKLRRGDQAPDTGRYEALNIFGARTGRMVHAEDGEALPAAPHGFTWRRIADEADADLTDQSQQQ
jgi:hypothetical protein